MILADLHRPTCRAHAVPLFCSWAPVWATAGTRVYRQSIPGGCKVPKYPAGSVTALGVVSTRPFLNIIFMFLVIFSYGGLHKLQVVQGFQEQLREVFSAVAFYLRTWTLTLRLQDQKISYMRSFDPQGWGMRATVPLQYVLSGL